MRSNFVKIDEAAFNRGVNEVLELKPIAKLARGVFALVTERASHRKETGTESGERRRGPSPTTGMRK